MFPDIRHVRAAAALRFTAEARDPAIRRQLSRLPLVGGMSSIPARAQNLPEVLRRVLPQVDRLHLFLHGYDAVPQGLERDGLLIYRGGTDHPYRASGKFYGLSQEPGPCLYFGFDDDILYPARHVRMLRAALLRYGGRALVGIHGSRYVRPFIRFTGERLLRGFWNGLPFDETVDVVGAGTCAFASEVVRFSPPAWLYGDMVDLTLAQDAERLGLPRVVVGRPSRSLQALPVLDEGLWGGAVRDDSRQTEQLKRLIEMIDNRPGAAKRKALPAQ